MKYVIVLLALSIANSAFAQGSDPYPRELTLSWMNTDSYVDNTLIEAGDLTGVRLECFRHDDTAVPIMNATIPANGEGLAQSETFNGAITRPGTYTCYGYSVVIGGIESDPSTPSVKKYVGKPRTIVFD